MPPGTRGFDVQHPDTAGETLLCGFTEFGLAGLSAADYLVQHLGLPQSGHVTTEQLPAITPFAAGRPRHHTRLYADDERDVSVLAGELFVPREAAKGLADALIDWAENANVDEICVLSGVPVAHGPEDHRPYYVATEDFHAHRIEGTDLTPMGGGYLDGVNGALAERGLESPLRVGVLTTPAHARTPDVEATLRLLEAVETVYGLGVDLEPLAAFAEEVEKQYVELSDRMEEAERRQQPEDRMYM
jgi:uncharacterized protein